MYHHMNVNLLFHETLVPELSGRGKFSCLRYVKIRILLPHFVIRERKRRILPFLVEKRRNLTFSRPYVQQCTYGRRNTPRSDALALQRRHISTIHRPQHPRDARGPRDAPQVSRGQNREDGRNPRPNPSHGGRLAAAEGVRGFFGSRTAIAWGRARRDAVVARRRGCGGARR